MGLGQVAASVAAPGIADRVQEALDQEEAMVRHQRHLNIADRSLACGSAGYSGEGRKDWQLDRPRV